MSILTVNPVASSADNPDDRDAYRSGIDDALDEATTATLDALQTRLDWMTLHTRDAAFMAYVVGYGAAVAALQLDTGIASGRLTRTEDAR